MRQLNRGLFLLLLATTSWLTACGGSDSGPAKQAVITGSLEDLKQDCNTGSNEINGCWKSTCVNYANTTQYGLYIVNFRADGTYTTYLHSYETSDCSGTPFSYGSILDEIYTTGGDILTTNGTMATTIDLTNSGFLGYSIFDITAGGELCFPDPDYRWDNTGGGLGPTIFTESLRYDTIDYTTCMTRLVP